MNALTLSHYSYRRLLLLPVATLLILLSAITWRLLSNATSVVTSTRVPSPIAASSNEAIDRLQRRLRIDAEDVDAYAQLGLAMLQQVRESNDMSLYSRAGEAFASALQRDPRQVDALMGQGVLALALHDFHGAIKWAEEARTVNPFRAGIVGILVDAYVELGRYDEAVATLQEMVDLRPDLQSYSRISYLRELHGDVDGAIDAMITAASTVMPTTEDWRWTMTHLGHLYFNRGDLDAAKAIYEQVLAIRSDYPFALEGMARVAAAQGETAQAIADYQALTKHLPLPQFVIALGELYEATGDLTAAQEQYDLVLVMQQLNAAAGMNVDLEMALFNASHSTDHAAVVNEARAAYADRPTIYAADALAWALHQNGNDDEAQQYSAEALRLGTQDAVLYYHAGMIAAARQESAAARSHLARALSINPYFSPLDGPIAHTTLASLQK